MGNKNLESLFQKTAEDTVNKVRLAGMRAGPPVSWAPY